MSLFAFRPSLYGIQSKPPCRAFGRQRTFDTTGPRGLPLPVVFNRTCARCLIYVRQEVSALSAHLHPLRYHNTIPNALLKTRRTHRATPQRPQPHAPTSRSCPRPRQLPHRPFNRCEFCYATSNFLNRAAHSVVVHSAARRALWRLSVALTTPGTRLCSRPRRGRPASDSLLARTDSRRSLSGRSAAESRSPTAAPSFVRADTGTDTGMFISRCLTAASAHSHSLPSHAAHSPAALPAGRPTCPKPSLTLTLVASAGASASRSPRRALVCARDRVAAGRHPTHCWPAPTHAAHSLAAQQPSHDPRQQRYRGLLCELTPKGPSRAASQLRRHIRTHCRAMPLAHAHALAAHSAGSQHAHRSL